MLLLVRTSITLNTIKISTVIVYNCYSTGNAIIVLLLVYGWLLLVIVTAVLFRIDYFDFDFHINYYYIIFYRLTAAIYYNYMDTKLTVQLNITHYKTMEQ